MKKLLLLFGTAALINVAISCGQNQSETEAIQQKEAKADVKPEKAEITVELYCKVNNELKTLLMEKYWYRFNGKSYDDVKNDYAQYREDEDAIYGKYGIADPLELNNFFRSNFSAIGEFQKDNPENKEYPEYQDAKDKLASFAMRKAME